LKDIIGIAMGNYRSEFSIFKTQPNLVYLDSASTALKPDVVIKKMNEYYMGYTANIHRGLYKNALKADEEFENVRSIVARFINGNSDKEVVFVSGTTMALNLVSNTIGKAKVKKGDEVVITEMEHHSNIVPWQMLCRERGAKLKFIEVENGVLKLEEGGLEKIVTRKTKIFSVTHISNVVGTINDVKKLIHMVKRISPDCVTVIDGAQGVGHMPIDVVDLGCDFMTFSGHKAYGPTGVGVLWGRGKILDELEPWMGGGDMIRKVTMKESSYKDAPNKLEAGTSNIGGVIGLGAAIEWLEKKDTKKIREHEVQITKYALEKLQEINCLDIYGPQNAEERGGLVAFNIKGVHSHDTAQILADRNICVRAGHHCAQPLHDKLKIFGSVRASFGVYTSKDDIDRLVEGLGKVIQKFGIK